MSENPHNSPVEIKEAVDGRSRLVPVAITLTVVSVLWAFFVLFGIVHFLSNLEVPVFSVFTLYMTTMFLYSLLLALGAVNMIRGGSYVWAIVTGCLALAPMLSPFYVLGIPIGIWALVVLRDPRVRASFQKD